MHLLHEIGYYWGNVNWIHFPYAQQLNEASDEKWDDWKKCDREDIEENKKSVQVCKRYGLSAKLTSRKAQLQEATNLFEKLMTLPRNLLILLMCYKNLKHTICEI